MVVDHEMDALNESLQVQEDVSDQIYLPTINRAEKLHTPYRNFHSVQMYRFEIDTFVAEVDFRKNRSDVKM